MARSGSRAGSPWVGSGVHGDHEPVQQNGIDLWEVSVIHAPKFQSLHQNGLRAYLAQGIHPSSSSCLRASISTGSSTDDVYKEVSRISPDTNLKTKHPGIRLLLECDESSFNFNDQETKDLIEHWSLPQEFQFLISHPQLNSGFSWKHLQSKDGNHTLQYMMCFGKNETLVLSHDLEAKITSGFWARDEAILQKMVLSGVTAETRHIQHPFFLPQQVLSALVLTLRDKAHKILEALASSFVDIQVARVSTSADVLERLAMQCSRRDLPASTVIISDLDNAVALGYFIMEGLSDLDPFCDAAMTAEQQEGFRNVVSFDIKRLQSFRNSITAKDAELQRHFGILHDLMMNIRERRVGEMIAKSSALIMARGQESDTSSMKTLAVLGMVFLPSTFIAALFSTAFFAFDSPVSGGVSPQFWIFWVIAIPLTLIVVLIWCAWHKWTAKKHLA